jgi:hypothetical protein
MIALKHNSHAIKSSSSNTKGKVLPNPRIMSMTEQPALILKPANSIGCIDDIEKEWPIEDN